MLVAKSKAKPMRNFDFVLGDELASKPPDKSLHVLLTREPNRRKIHVVHPGMSYTNTFKSGKITFIGVAECSGNVFSNTVHQE